MNDYNTPTRRAWLRAMQHIAEPTTRDLIAAGLLASCFLFSLFL
jgi:hypothetical protein